MPSASKPPRFAKPQPSTGLRARPPTSALQTELNSAADAAHARNDGKEEQACREALKDVNQRLSNDEGGVGGLVVVAPPQPFRYEKKDK
jgi:hypothetical protein